MKLKCPHCGVSGTAASLTGDRLVRCPRCAELFLLPEAEEPRQAVSAADLFQSDAAVLSSSLSENDGQPERENLYDPVEQEPGDPAEEDLLADESWLTEDSSDDPVAADPDWLSDPSEGEGPENLEIHAGEIDPVETAGSPVRSEAPFAWTDEFAFDTAPAPEDSESGMSGILDDDLKAAEEDDEDGGSAELAFEETFDEELAASSDYQDSSDTGNSKAKDFGGSFDEEDAAAVKNSKYPDFTEHQVSWQEEQQAQQVADDVDVAASQPSEEAIQQELDEMLATTCVACDNRVGEDEIYCPDCLKKKAAGTGSSAALAADAAAAQSGNRKKALWVGTGVLAVVLIGLTGFLLFQWGLI